MKIEKKKYLLITGGTGGHVIPAENFANFLLKKNINCSIMTDKRGLKYIKKFNGKVHIINSSNLSGNLIHKIFGIVNLLLGFFKSLFIIYLLKPNKIISFGSYASFFPMISCIFFKIFYKNQIYIHEQNSILGRTNSFFLNYINKLFLNFDIKSNINSKFQNNSYIVGTPENNINNLNSIKSIELNEKFTILIFGGSQGSEYLANFAMKLIKIISNEKLINVKFYIQCPKNMIKKISNNLKNIKFEIVIKDYFQNIDDILKISSLAISRSGAGSISDLINYKIPAILIPLPSSKDNHQYSNALIMKNHELAIIIDQNSGDISDAKKYIYKIYNNKQKNLLNYMNAKFDKIKVKNSNTIIYKLISNEK